MTIVNRFGYSFEGEGLLEIEPIERKRVCRMKNSTALNKCVFCFEEIKMPSIRSISCQKHRINQQLSKFSRLTQEISNHCNNIMIS